MSPLVGGTALLAAGAGVLLVLGWSSDDPVALWISLAASACAAALVFFAATRSPRRPGRD